MQTFMAQASFRNVVLMLMAVALWAPQAVAQTAKSIIEDYDNTIKASRTITAFGPELFGEQVSLKDGATSFGATDVSLRLNSGLPMTVGRSLGMNSRDVDEYADWVADGELFGNWKLDVPYMSGIYDQRTGWVSRMPNPQQRCSVASWSNAGPPAVPSAYSYWSNIHYQPEQYWSGDRISIPGKGSQPLLYLPADRSRPNDGRAYYWTTKNDWRVSCLSSLRNGAGEGYLVVLPDGTRYTFDWMSSRQVAALKDTQCGEGGLTGGTSCAERIVSYRREYFLHATRIEDRFGNWVAYDYDQANPRRLRTVSSSEGASISLTYNASGKIATVSTNGRTWQYQYAGACNCVLSAVVLPDGSRWTFQYGDMNWLLQQQKIAWVDCEPVLPPTTRTEAVTIGHPSGATGIFTFKKLVHGTERTPGGCTPNVDRPTRPDMGPYPAAYKVASLLSKQITGPGLTAQAWSYAYQPGWSWNPSAYVDDCSVPEADCNATTTTEVTGPDGTITRSVFGNDYYRTAGQLLRVEVVSNGAVVQSALNTYVADAVGQAFPDRVGWDPNSRANALETEKLRPQRGSVITREGTTFAWEVPLCGSPSYCFDAYARPGAIRRYSSLGHVKNETRTYLDDVQLWVLGLPSATTIDGTVVESTEYNAQRLPWRMYRFGRLQDTVTYNANGTIATVADGRGNAMTVTGWKRGIPLQIRHPATAEAPAGATESASVDDNGWIQWVVDETGARTCYGHDVMGRINRITYPSSAQPGTCDTSRWDESTYAFEYIAYAEHGIAAGHWRMVGRDGSNKHINTYYDAMWRPVLEETLDATNVGDTLTQVVKRYDSDGRLTFQSYPTRGVDDAWAISQGTRTFYDALDRVTRVEQDSEQGVLATVTEYLPGLKVRVTNPRAQSTTTTFMAWDEPAYELPVLSQQPEGKVIEIARHPQFGRVLSLTQRNVASTLSQTRRYVYDAHAQLCKTIEPETGATVMDYDAAGNVTQTTAGLAGDAFGSTTDCQRAAALASGRTSTREYDARNRLAQLLFPDGRGNQIWTYAADGLPASVTAYNTAASVDGGTPVITAYTYNNRRLLAGESLTQPNWYTWGVGYDYDRIGNLRWQSYPTGLTLDYAPNALGQPLQVKDAAGTIYASGAQYHPNGSLKQFAYGNGIVHTMTQNARQLPARVTSSDGVLDYTYNYDANGNATNIWDLARGDHYSRWLNYDNLDRLTAAGSAGFGGDAWHRMTYDALDNIESWKLAGVKDYADYVYDAGNRLTAIRNTAGATVVGIAYDPQGNLHNKNGQFYDFDFGNRLRAVSGKEYYRYDGLGRRVVAWEPTTNSILSQYTRSGHVVYQENHRNSIASEHVYLAGSLIATSERNWVTNVRATKYQHTDALGSPVAVTNASGQVIERNDYEPWGAIIGKPNHNGIGYTGHVMDGATGLTYMQQRYYDQSIGRFLSVDPVTADSRTGGNFNRYWYANNSPYRFTDPDGRRSREEADHKREMVVDRRSMNAHPSLRGSVAITVSSQGASSQPSQAKPQQVTSSVPSESNKKGWSASSIFTGDKTVTATGVAALGGGIKAEKVTGSGNDKISIVTPAAGLSATVTVNILTVGYRWSDQPMPVDLGVGGGVRGGYGLGAGAQLTFDPGGVSLQLNGGAGLGASVDVFGVGFKPGDGF